MKNKLQQKICAMFQRTIKFSLHIFSQLCVSLKRDNSTTEKDLCEKEKCGKFEDNFDKTFYMANKEEIDDIEKLSQLIIKIRDKNISVLEFGEFRRLLTKLTIIDENEYGKLITELKFINDEDIVNKLTNYLKENTENQINIQTFIGSMSGATMSTQINFFNKYKKEKNEKNKKN